MSFIKISRAWCTDPRTQINYFLSTYSLFGVPVLKVKRTSIRKVYFLGILIHKEKISKQTAEQAIHHLLGATIDIHKLPPASGLLRTFQLAEFELLKKVDQVCRKHGIQYWLDFGSMLGAVRHHGFIPWDDDVDIAMLREDYERFLSVLDDEFPADIYTTNSVGFLQIHVKDTMLQIDIFIYDQAADAWFPEGEAERNFIQRVYNAASKLQFSVEFDQEQQEGIVNYTYNQRKLLIREEILGGRESAIDGNIFRAIEVPVGKRFSMKYEWVFPLKMVDYEGFAFPVPQNTDAILFLNYGDWESIPKNPSYHFDLNKLTLKSYLRLLEITRKGL